MSHKPQAILRPPAAHFVRKSWRLGESYPFAVASATPDFHPAYV